MAGGPSRDGMDAVGRAAAELEAAAQGGAGAGPEGYGHHVRRAATAWAELTSGQRDRLISARPRLVGNTDGVPVADRYRANALAMTRDLREVTTRSGRSRAVAPGAVSRKMLERVASWKRGSPRTASWDGEGGKIDADLLQDLRGVRRTPGAAEPTADDPFAGLQILAYRRAQGRGDRGAVVEVFGDLTAADLVLVDVPGMRNFPRNFVAGLRANTIAVERAVARGVRRDLRNDPAPRIGSVAAVSWLGYHTPSGIGATSDRLAMAGARRLAGFLTGLGEQIRPGARFMVNSHSCGTLTTNLTFKELATDPSPGRPLDVVKFTGSPGIGPDGTRYVPDGTEVYATARNNDFVAQSGAHGPRPHVPGADPRIVTLPDPTDNIRLPWYRALARFVPGPSAVTALSDHVHYGVDDGSLYLTSIVARDKTDELERVRTAPQEVAGRLYPGERIVEHPHRWAVPVGTAVRRVEAGLAGLLRHLPVHRFTTVSDRVLPLPATAAGNARRANERLERLVARAAAARGRDPVPRVGTGAGPTARPSSPRPGPGAPPGPSGTAAVPGVDRPGPAPSALSASQTLAAVSFPTRPSSGAPSGPGAGAPPSPPHPGPEPRTPGSRGR